MLCTRTKLTLTIRDTHHGSVISIFVCVQCTWLYSGDPSNSFIFLILIRRENHDRSKKHREAVEELRLEMLAEDEALELSLSDAGSFEEPEASVITSPQK